MNKQKTLYITFLISSEDEKSEEDCVVVPREADAQEKRGEEERDTYGLIAEILETRSVRRSPVKDW